MPIKRLGFPLAPDEMRELLALAGKAAALEMLLEGRLFGTSEAKEKGLLTRISENVSEASYVAARRIAAGAPLAGQMNKRILRRLSRGGSALDETELRNIFSFAATQDYQQGIRSFLAGHPASFSGE